MDVPEASLGHLRRWWELLADHADAFGEEYEIVTDSWIRGYNPTEMGRRLVACGLGDIGLHFDRVSSFAFLDRPPTTWDAGQLALRELVSEGRVEYAKTLADYLLSDDYDIEIVAQLPWIPDDYDEAWGTEEDWERKVGAWTAAYEAHRAQRRISVKSLMADAYREHGDIGAALAIVPADDLDVSAFAGEWASENGHMSRSLDLMIRTALTAARLQGWKEGRETAALSAETERKVSETHESSRRQERLSVVQHGSSVRVEGLIESLAGLSLEAFAAAASDSAAARVDQIQLPGLIADAVLAKLSSSAGRDAEFELLKRDLIREWREAGEAERTSWPRRRAETTVGSAAWRLLEPVCMDELELANVIRGRGEERFGAKLGLIEVVVFEREFRSALTRAGLTRNEQAATLSPQLEQAQRLGDARLAEIASIALRLGLVDLRNRAAHGDEFTAVHLKRLENALFQEGLDGHGLLSNVVMYKRDQRSDNPSS